MLYLAPYVGQGTRLLPFQPALTRLFGGTWSCVDLRPDRTVQDGFAFVWMDRSDDLEASGLLQCGLDRSEVLSPLQRLRISNKLGISLTATNTVEEVLQEVLFTPDKPWKFVRPDFLGRKHVYLNGQEWAFRQVNPPVGAEIIDPTDDFIRADQDPIAGNWVNGGLGANLRIVSNELATGGGAIVDSSSLYNPFTSQADCFCEVTVGSSGGDTNDFGPVTRGSNSLGFSGYMFDPYTGQFGLGYWLVNSLTNFAAYQSSGGYATNTVVRIESQGSSHKGIVNGATVIGPATDTTIAVGGKAGVLMFNNVIRIKFFQAGDLAPPPAAGIRQDFSDFPKQILSERERGIS